VFLVDGPLALDLLGQVWGDAHDVGCDGQTWWYRRKGGADEGAHTAPSPGEMDKMIADDHAFLPVRRAS
jgi:hypothetical protein